MAYGPKKDDAALVYGIAVLPGEDFEMHEDLKTSLFEFCGKEGLPFDAYSIVSLYDDVVLVYTAAHWTNDVMELDSANMLSDFGREQMERLRKALKTEEFPSWWLFKGER